MISFKNLLQKILTYGFFRQKINSQILQAIAILNGLLNVLGAPGYILLKDYRFAAVQFTFGFLFLGTAFLSYFYRTYNVGIQWLFFGVISAFVFLNAVNAPDSLAYIFFIPLAIIATVTSFSTKTAIVQTTISILTLTTFFAYYYVSQNDFVFIYKEAEKLVDPFVTSINIMALNSVIFIIIMELYRRSKNETRQLLLKTLPETVVREMEQNGHFQPKKVDKVAVLFLDFVDFTKRSSLLKPDEILTILNEYFLSIEEVCKRNKVEKIKTIGDGFMAVAGTPNHLENPAHNVLMAAQEIIDKIQQINQKDERDWEVRIGLHIGPVIAGVAGEDKCVFDVWGDTVNLASRMEQNAKKMSIAISEDFYHEFHNLNVDLEGIKNIKGKGNMPVYSVGKKVILET